MIRFRTLAMPMIVLVVILSLASYQHAGAVTPDSETEAAVDTTPTSDLPTSNPADTEGTPEASTADSTSADSPSEVQEAAPDLPSEPPPFDYAPYRVLVWVATDSATINADSIRSGVMNYLERDFGSIWRTTISDAPAAVQTAAMRDLKSLSFELIAASDPVIAVKKGHKDELRIRFASDAGRFLNKILGTQDRVEEVSQTVAADPESKREPAKFEWVNQLEAIPGDVTTLTELWKNEETEALVVSRGMAEILEEPKAKIIVPPLKGQVVEAMAAYDKIYIVRVQAMTPPLDVQVTEFDTLMRHFTGHSEMDITTAGQLPLTVGAALRQSFSPLVRIDNAGKDNAEALVQASGLALDPESPAHIRVGDVLEPMVRKNDRNGNPIAIGPLDFAYLHVTEVSEDRRKVKMNFYAGRMGGLQGRKNNRTFRMGVKIRPPEENTTTTVRLHAKGDPNQPLIGYEIYDKELEGKAMTFVGRTDWSGRMQVGPNENPLRLMYVKNGGAVLARLPIVPGFHEEVVADLAGDDMRLQAESYIRGVQNAIIDLVAIRELFKARIRLRLREGEMDAADELLEALRNEPTNEKLANDMGKKQAMFLKAIGRNANQQRKVDEMFSTTRDLLAKHINPRLLRELEADFIAAKQNGGKLPEQPASESE